MDTGPTQQKITKVCALPEIRAWLDEDLQESLKRQRAIEMLAFLHTEAWKPRGQRWERPGVAIFESCGPGHLTRTVDVTEDATGYVVFTAYQKRYAVRLALLWECLSLLYPAHRLRRHQAGFSWTLRRSIARPKRAA